MKKPFSKVLSLYNFFPCSVCISHYLLISFVSFRQIYFVVPKKKKRKKGLNKLEYTILYL